MATLNSIEQRMLEMDGGEFQKLCDGYLSAIGYGAPHSFGSVAGSNKVRKGTPDTFFELPNGKFVFAEYTTQRENLFGKLAGDLEKCFDEEKTKVPVSKIQEIVLCYLGELQPSDVMSLNSNCQIKGVKLTLLGTSALSQELIKQHLLVRKFLNLSLDTGQVIPLEAFPEVYGKSKFAITLGTNFHFREKEISDALDALESYDLIIIFGKPGVGKSRFALEACRNFVAKHFEYEAHSIVSLSRDLFEDLQEKFLSPKNALILVDDANRVTRFSYFMHILRHQKEHQHIKIVVTVRDYAFDNIENDIGNYPHHSIGLTPLSDQEIQELAKTEFGILNALYLERIVAVSAGNPRIAVMVSQLATEKNSLNSINDVSALYDEYFSSIKEDLHNFGEPELLKTAGIIAFLRAVDRNNEEMMSRIQEAFGISTESFWTRTSQLHRLEMVDLYENEVVRISDQVLATYLFYLAFFKDKVLDFADLLKNYFPNSRSRINDSLFPALSSFDQNAILEVIRPKVHQVWSSLEQAGDEENLLTLATSFSFLHPNETLRLVKLRISQKQFAPPDFSVLEPVDSNRLNNVSPPIEIQLLGSFRNASPDLTDIALEMLLDYLAQRPQAILDVLHVLVHDYGFDRLLNITGVAVQRKVVKLLWRRADKGKSELYSRLFIAVADEYLKTQYETFESRSERTVTIYTFTAQASQQVLRLRDAIFHHLFDLYSRYQDYVFASLEKYVDGYHQGTPNEIFNHDSLSILAFIQTNLNPGNYKHNILVQHYLDFIENHGVKFDGALRKEFTDDTFLVYALISENRRDLIALTHEEHEQKRREQFLSQFAHFSEADAIHFVDLCTELGRNAAQGHKSYDLISGFVFGLGIFAETKPHLFASALEHYLTRGDALNLYAPALIRTYMGIYGKENTLAFLTSLSFSTKTRWLLGFYVDLTLNQVEIDDLKKLYELLMIADYSDLPGNLDFVLNYISIDKRALAKIVKIILDKGNPQHSAWALASVMNPYSDMDKQLVDLFMDDVETFEQAYLIVKAGGRNEDHNSTTLAWVLELDPGFIVRYIEWIYAPKSEDSRWHHDTQDYSLLWRHANHREIFKKIIELVYEKEEKIPWHTELTQFFMASEGNQLDADIRLRQDGLLLEYINTRYQDIGFMEFLFEVISNFSSDRCSRLIIAFLKHNKDLAAFQRLHIGYGPMSWSGSAVPVYQERIDFLRSLLPLLNSAQLLEHRNYITERINGLEIQKGLEKKKDFIGE